MIRKPTTFATSALVFVLSIAGLTPAMAQFTGVFTQHNDNARTGQNLNETTLTTANVTAKSFGRVFSYSVDGQIYAQPLYVPNVTIGGTVHNVVYVATENDSLYAFDADYKSPTPLWQVSFVNPGAGITPVLCSSKVNPNVYCSVYPMIGITSTPVIDPTTKTIYLVTRSQKGTTYYVTLHAVDITTGAEKFGGPVNISGSVPGTGLGSKNGVLTFPAATSIQRAGLLLANGTIYIGFAGTQHGWLISYDAATLKQKSIMSNTPNSAGGGVWASGNGVVADASGNVFAAISDGGFDISTGGVDYGDTLAKFDPNMNLLDYFTPMDQSCRASNDLDLGSGGPMILPPQQGSVTNEILIAGKGGQPCDTNPADAPIYLVNQDAMGGYNPTADADVQDIVGAPHGYWSSPAYWQGPAAQYVYYGGVVAEAGQGDTLKAFTLSNGLLSTTPASQTSQVFPVGVTPSVSASVSNGVPQNGIVWAVERPDALGVTPGLSSAVLFAYNATNLGSLLYSSNQAIIHGGLRDRGGCANKFAVPTIANGRVYVGTQNELDVFGILTVKTGPDVYLGNPCWKFPDSVIGTPVSQPIALTNVGNATLTISSLSIAGFNAADFSQTNTCTSVAPGAKCTITVTFNASILGPESGYVMINDNASGSPHNIFVIGVGKN